MGEGLRTLDGMGSSHSHNTFSLQSVVPGHGEGWRRTSSGLVLRKSAARLGAHLGGLPTKVPMAGVHNRGVGLANGFSIPELERQGGLGKGVCTLAAGVWVLCVV